MTDHDKDTLRDIFAGLAMCALIIRDEEDIAKEAYRFADEMMEAREPMTLGLPAIKKRTRK
jgi:hypothetical protein